MLRGVGDSFTWKSVLVSWFLGSSFVGVFLSGSLIYWCFVYGCLIFCCVVFSLPGVVSAAGVFDIGASEVPPFLLLAASYRFCLNAVCVCLVALARVFIGITIVVVLASRPLHY